MSASVNHSAELPPEVITCLKNARYLHLATSDGLWPHVSLMNYTYLPNTPHPLPPTSITPSETITTGPVIVMTTHPENKKTINLTSNPRVSLLVHDWVSHRPSFSSSSNPFSSSPPQNQSQLESPPPSSLATLLTNLNQAALSSVSATLTGYAHVIPHESEQEQYYKKLHTENNPMSDDKCYVEGEDVRVVVVRIAWARVADHKGGTKDWVAEGEEQAHSEFERSNGGRGMVNGA